MNIGIDIDNVISNFDEALLEEYLKHDNDLRGTGIVNKDLHMTEGMFDWTEKEEREFYLANIERIVKTLDVKDGAKEYIDKLKQDGHNIFIITGRDNGEYANPVEMTHLVASNIHVHFHSAHSDSISYHTSNLHPSLRDNNLIQNNPHHPNAIFLYIHI